MAVSTRKQAKTLWHILFEFRGSIWSSVLPYCIFNCLIMLGVEALGYLDVKIAFSPSGHGLMTLIVSFLVISKVNLTYDRYMMARHATGHALAALRELHQTALIYTQHIPSSNTAASKWRQQNAARIIDLMDCTMRVIKSELQSTYLARNSNVEYSTDDDPMLHVQGLRSHLYTVNSQAFGDDSQHTAMTTGQQLQLFERMKMCDLLNDFVFNYRNLLKCSSTPLPFPLIQMGRTFLFLWTFTIPLVLRGVVEEMYSAIVFVFFLTYGFVGLELVAMKMMNPFGDGVNDLNVTGMKEATIIGMEKDMQVYGESAKLMDKRTEFSRQKPRGPMASSGVGYSTPNMGDTTADPGHSGVIYHSMGDIYPNHS